MIQHRELIISCEHGGNRIPPDWVSWFDGATAMLESHRGFDLGALVVAQYLAESCRAELFSTTVSRLLVDCNRSPGHPALFSSFTKALSMEEKEAILATCYHPHRRGVEEATARAIKRSGQVLHLSVHSFTPQLAGQVRKGDIGLLYDPAREGEREFCLAWRARLKGLGEGLLVRRNYPYRGTADGLVTWLRKKFSLEHYLGVELELNQGLATDRSGWLRVAELVRYSLAPELWQIRPQG